jgi:hypothetical protein
VPQVVLTAAWHDDVLEVYPGLPDKVGLLVIVEDRHLELVIVGRIVDCEAELLIPEKHVLDTTFYFTLHNKRY